jgi:hypothetical protein
VRLAAEVPSYLIDVGPANLDGKPLTPLQMFIRYLFLSPYSVEDVLRALRRYEDAGNGTPPTAA